MGGATIGSGEASKVLVAVLNYNRDDQAAETIGHLQKQDGVPFDLEIFDNASERESLARLSHFCPTVAVTRLDENLGYAGGSNAILQIAADRGYDLVVICNNDIEPAPGTIAKLVHAAEQHSDAAVVGTVEKDSLGTVRACVGVGYNLWLSRTNWEVPRDTETRAVMCVQGAIVLYRISAFNAGVSLDPLLFTYYEEPDLGRRLAQLGWKAVFVGDSFIVHKNDDRTLAPRVGFYLQRNRVILVAKYGSFFQLLFHIVYVAIIELPIKMGLRAVQGHRAYAAACYRGFADGVSVAYDLYRSRDG